MYDLSQPAERAGDRCPKCSGSGLYCWGGTVNGVSVHSGPCHSCAGTGVQSQAQIARNRAYNRYKISQLAMS